MAGVDHQPSDRPIGVLEQEIIDPAERTIIGFDAILMDLAEIPKHRVIPQSNEIGSLPSRLARHISSGRLAYLMITWGQADARPGA
jgi:hypothetical protein